MFFDCISYINLGRAYDCQAKYEKAVNIYFKAECAYAELYGKNDPKFAILYNNYARAEYKWSKCEDAIYHLKEAHRILTCSYVDDHFELAVTLNHLGVAYRIKGEYATSIDFHKKCGLILLDYYPPEHEYVKRNYKEMAEAYRDMGDIEMAKEYFAKSKKE